MRLHPLFILGVLSALVPVVWAGTPADKSGYLLKTNLHYHADSRTVASTKEFILDENTKSWVNLTDPKNGVLVSGKVKRSDETTLAMEFLVLDSSKEPVVVANPALSIKLGEEMPATLEIDTHDDLRFSIGLTASKTAYR